MTAEKFKCIVCEGKLELNIDNFPPEKSKKNGLSSTCRACKREHLREWRINRSKKKLPCPTQGCTGILKASSRCDKCSNQIRRHGKTFPGSKDYTNLITVHNETSEIQIFHKSRLLGVVTVDTEDLVKLKEFNWCYRLNEIFTTNGSRRLVTLLIDCKEGYWIQRIDGNIWDCRKSNLEIRSRTVATRHNKIPKSNSSGIKGVSWDDRSQRWIVYLTNNGKRHFGGSHEDIVDAIEARKELEVIHWGDVYTGKSDYAKEQLLKGFQKHYNLLKKSIDKHLVFTPEETKRLKDSFDYLRSNKKNGKLTASQIKLVESLPGFVWYKKKDFSNFEYLSSYYALLDKFLKREGHLMVNVDNHVEDGVHLGIWVQRIRTYYRKGKLPKHVIKKLESYDEWVWEPNEVQAEITFQKHFNLLKSFVQKHGILKNYVSELKPAHDYFSKRKKVGSLTEYHFNLLESLPGFTWARQDDEWMRKYNVLIEDPETILSQSYLYEVSGIKIGVWINLQRTLYRKGELQPERQRLLENIPGWFWKYRDSPEEEWMHWYKALKNYVNLNGSATKVLPTTEYDGRKIGQWVGTQKQKYKGKIYPLQATQIKLLEDIPGWSWTSRKFKENYDLIVQYQKENGHTLIPKSYRVNDIPLGAWASKLRTKYKRNQLDTTQIKMLNKIPNWIWKRESLSWDDYFHVLRIEVNRIGEFKISNKDSIDGVNIGNWIQRQRKLYKNNELSKEAISLLEDIPGWFWSKEDKIRNQKG